MVVRFASSTRRGLVFILYSETLFVPAAIAFVLVPSHPAILLAGVVLSALVGFPAGLALWGGRHEFGPEHARALPRAALAAAALAACLVLALFELTNVFPTSLRLRDLYGPWFFLGAALLADTACIVLLLRPLAAEPGRRWIRLTLVLGLTGSAAYGYVGWSAVSGYLARAGETAADAAEAQSYVRDFSIDVLRYFALVLLALRFGFWPALYRAITHAAEAEIEAEHATRADAA